jgi:hypothetical protein
MQPLNAIFQILKNCSKEWYSFIRWWQGISTVRVYKRRQSWCWADCQSKIVHFKCSETGWNFRWESSFSHWWFEKQKEIPVDIFSTLAQFKRDVICAVSSETRFQLALTAL